MPLIYLDERRKIAAADALGTLAPFGKGATRRQMGDIGRQAWNLEKVFSLLVSRIGHAF